MSLNSTIHWSRPAGRSRGIDRPRRAVVDPLEALPLLYRGFAQLARVLAQTLGPTPRLVLNTSLLDT
ncbi:MAG: hypothetical protein J2P37_30390, partial [Ktedonobacteraceae bacterium]|nr:hypothetical protein [Ktedonobacteraceae bacterium]